MLLISPPNALVSCGVDTINSSRFTPRRWPWQTHLRRLLHQAVRWPLCLVTNYQCSKKPSHDFVHSKNSALPELDGQTPSFRSTGPRNPLTTCR